MAPATSRPVSSHIEVCHGRPGKKLMIDSSWCGARTPAYQGQFAGDGWRSPSNRCREAVTRPAYGLHQRIDAVGFQRLAQAPDVHIDRTLLDIHIATPYVVEQLRARVHALGMGHEKMQQAVFGWPDLDRVLAREYAMRGDIDPQPSCLDIAFGGFFVGGAHYRADTGRSEEHTSELQSLMRISYAVFC